MEPATVNRDVDLDLAPDALWQLVSDPAEMSGWLGDDVDLDVRPGGTGTIADGDGDVRDVRVDRVDSGRMVLTWWDRASARESEVVLEVISRPDGGSRLRITETLLGVPPAPQARAHALDAVRSAWEVRVLSLWACSVAAALV